MDAALADVNARNADPLQASNHDYGAVNFLKTLQYFRTVRHVMDACITAALI